MPKAPSPKNNVPAPTSFMILLITLATIGAAGTGIVYAPPCMPGVGCPPHDPDDAGHGQSSHDINGDVNSKGHA